jgi:DNA gyrase/topoisomerase IV subunit A
MIPGTTNLQRIAYTGGVTSIFAAAVQTNLYIPTEETFMVASFVIVVRALYVLLRKPITEWTDTEYNRLRDLIIKFCSKERQQVENSISTLESYRDALDVTKALFRMRREALETEVQLKAVLARTAFMNSQRALLEERTRALEETNREKVKVRNEALIQAVLQRLSDAEIQGRLLEKCVADLQKI